MADSLIGMRFEGGTDLERAFGELSFNLARTVFKTSLADGGEVIADYAAGIAPRRPGLPDIADHIVVGPARNADEPAAVAVGPERAFHYGLPLEIGTATTAAQPFMRPALDAKAEQALAVIGESAWRELAAKGISQSGVSEGPVLSEGGGGLL